MTNEAHCDMTKLPKTIVVCRDTHPCAHLLSAASAVSIICWNDCFVQSVAGLPRRSAAATAPCSHLGSESAFLTQVLAELPQPALVSFCDIHTGGQTTVHPDETGVSHFVLPGLIPKQVLGEENHEWKLVREGKQLVGSLDSEPAVLHLWLRAACTGQVLGMSIVAVLFDQLLLCSAAVSCSLYTLHF